MTNEYYLFTHQGWTDIFLSVPSNIGVYIKKAHVFILFNFLFSFFKYSCILDGIFEV